MEDTSQEARYDYTSPLSLLDAKPSEGDTFEAPRKRLFTEQGEDTLTVVDVEEKHIANGSGYRGNGIVAAEPADDTRTKYVVTLEDPDGARFEKEEWKSNLNW
jgi:hypothetical protein